MEFATRGNKKASSLVKIVAEQCLLIIDQIPKNEKMLNLQPFLKVASMLAIKLDKILKKRDFMNDWKSVSAMQLHSMKMTSSEMSAILARVGQDIREFHEGLEKKSAGFVALFKGMMVTQHSMREFEMTDEAFLNKFHEHVCDVQEAVLEIEKNLETLMEAKGKKSILEGQNVLEPAIKRFKFS